MIRPSVVFCLEKMTVSRWLPISLSCLAGHLVHSLTNKCERLQGNTNGAIAPFLSVAMAAVKRLSLLYVLTLASKLYVCMSLVCTYSLLYMIVAKQLHMFDKESNVCTKSSTPNSKLTSLAIMFPIMFHKTI